MDHTHQFLSFTFEQHSIHVIRRTSQIWFVATDIINALNLPDSPAMTAGLADHEVVRTLLPEACGLQGAVLVTEAGLYRLMNLADKPVLKRFTRWLLREVMPTVHDPAFVPRPSVERTASLRPTAERTPQTLYDLDYVKDLRQDPTQIANAGWWQFKRLGGDTGVGSYDQGEHFFRQTHQLVKTNPGDAEDALTHSLVHCMSGFVKGHGLRGCELAFCRLVSRAAVAWMRASELKDWPPVFSTD
ncbi:BRO-N domain-containing protein [Saccharospirillum salsuginis]|uniref:Bro-N domain-containing protein n=1 Tax=Saccharospirillum salsuginis TaxID=418750 RepID=A0A918KCU8_9GAMM|nr:BRO family protein [Saccharospirillum salsuginis]GGX57433.1 hypothetical protein GCM10007392_26250 [Saccharospirillum salsuginis]